MMASKPSRQSRLGDGVQHVFVLVEDLLRPAEGSECRAVSGSHAVALG
jgi:hypothetical protein